MAREQPKEEEVSNARYWGGIFCKCAALVAVVGFIAFLLWYFGTNLGK
jgi:hypothetical protein